MRGAERGLWLAAGGGLGLLALSLVLALLLGHDDTTSDDGALRIEHRGQRLGFGPFVGYTIHRGDDPQRIRFVCRNDDQFYTIDLPDGTLLYEGEGRLVDLPPGGRALPTGRRINPLSHDEVPAAWLATRPEPREEWRHFHSCYDENGAVRSGYWLRHVAKDSFTYDMGGRVGAASVLHHVVEPGVDRDFALLMEFDQGP